MHSSTYLTYLFLILSAFFSFTLSDPRISEAELLCGTSRPSSITNLIRNFVKVMESISEQVTEKRWGYDSVTSSSPQLFGLAQCHEDLSQTDCLLCFAESRTKLPRCLPNLSGRIYLDGCFLRYENYSFFHESTDSRSDKVNCSSPVGILKEDYMRLEFAMKVDEVVTNVTAAAMANGGFSVAEVKGGVVGAYALAQCWKSIDERGCRECLNSAGLGVRRCAPGGEGRGLNAGCYLRYSTEKFYSAEAESKVGDGGLTKKGIIVIVVLSTAAFSMLCLFGAYVGYKKLAKAKEESNILGRISSNINKSNVNFKYETLEKATDFFNPSRKLGQGGAGSVFRGTLPDGKTVAVKRLFFNTRQWVDEFFNEVNLISGIQHKNLVKLLGCSIEGPESLLVYEFVPNKSLEQFLFDKNKTQILRWQQRVHIILGVAEGLSFLHGGSKVRIIHRDIKGSNILLEEDLTPKIADFGLARCFATDKSHISTGIAGTLGYMAPEYLVRGQLTEKADVYAFGVLVLEIVCGRKTNVFMQDSGSILQTVWTNYKSNNLTKSIDVSLEGEFPLEEASNVLQIGLLCTQASVPLRPSMCEVVKMLTNKEGLIPSPKQPPFLNASLLNQDDSSEYSSVINSRQSIPDVYSASTFKSSTSASLQSLSLENLG